MTSNDTAKLLQDLLSSIIPGAYGAKTIVFPISDADWEDVLHGIDGREDRIILKDINDEEGLYITPDEVLPTAKKGDWTGIYREQRSAFLIIGALKSEGVL